MKASLIQARIDATVAQITAYEAAVLAFGDSAIQSYRLDTGQSQQTVTRANLTELQRTIDTLYNRCATLEARLNGSGVVHARPGW